MHVDVKTSSSYGAVGMIKLLTENPRIIFRKARLNTHSYVLDSDSNSKDWPLIFECQSNERDCSEFEIRVYSLTSGYSGSGPHDLIECLNIAGFRNIDEDEIFTIKEIKRTYEK